MTAPATPDDRPRRRRDWSRPALTAWAVLVYAFLFLPIAFIVVYSFNNGRALLVWSGFGGDAYRNMLENEPLKQAVRNSLEIAVGSALIATILGSLAGIALARRPGRWTVAFVAVVFLILVTPEIVDAIAYLIWFVRVGGPFESGFGPFGPGDLRLWVSHSIFSSAVVTLIVRARLAGLEESLEEAAADLGATPTRAFRQITLPLMMPAVLAGALLAFTFSLDNTIVSTFVSTAGSSTLPVYIFSAVRSVIRPDVAAISTVMLLLTLVALAVVALVLRRSGESAEDIAATITGA
ncbi:MAG: ABC transporter permease [Acidimicrobiales bacterium]|nr:ABC transporter permease [Acidimicrobiales bacterium]